jgi:crossover junction endodeoxyribonuclease RuvC
MKIISIDPGYERLGIAILEKEKGGNEEFIYSNCFKTSAKLPHHVRLGLLADEVEKVVKKYKPELLAIETLFFSNNQKTAMKVSEARGSIISTCVQNGLDVFEYSPIQIKVAVTGYGRGDKNSIAKMVPLLINLPKEIKSDDEMDAVAIGLTYFASN